MLSFCIPTRYTKAASVMVAWSQERTLSKWIPRRCTKAARKFLKFGFHTPVKCRLSSCLLDFFEEMKFFLR